MERLVIASRDQTQVEIYYRKMVTSIIMEDFIMMKYLLTALESNATGRTRKYFLETEEGKKMTTDFLRTIAELLAVDYKDSIVAYNGSSFDQTDYQVIGNVSELWNASKVYPSSKDVLRKSNSLYDDMVIPKDLEGGKILTPVEMETYVNRYNENQKDNNFISLVQLSGVKGVEYYDLKAFISNKSICEGNVNGSIAPEVSVFFRYHNMLGASAIIDEINQKAVELWLLAKN